MLYVFWVERGSIITLNVDVAVDTVANLKSVLSNPQRTGIPADNQVLLISGGDCLQDDRRVAHYQGTGTDTNPIFLFNRAAIESDQLPDYSSEHLPHVPDEREARENMESVLALPTNLNSISIRTQLAQQYHDYARELNRQCTTMVNEQHLQHQGWQAVMANLEDVVAAYLKRLERFKVGYSGYLDNREESLVKLNRLSETMEILGRITLFPSLLRRNHDNGKVTGEKESGGDAETSGGITMGKIHADGLKGDEITILDWISAKDSEHSLQAVAEGCRRTIEAFDESMLDEVDKESGVVVELCNNAAMKEIKGLAERLYGLDQLLSDAKKVVMEQKETAEILFKLQSRMTGSGTKDNQMLKDMSDMSTEPFGQLLRGHVKLCDIRKRCLSAKQELCKHLHSRLKWVVAVENSVSEVDDKIRIYYENIRRIKRLLHMLDQVNSAPHVFILAVLEVLRRKRYAREFIQAFERKKADPVPQTARRPRTWARSVSEKAVAAYTKETDARSGFLKQHGSHFLLSLFPGLDMYPPQFAATAPVDFDTTLPSLTVEDLEMLRSRIPDFDEQLHLPDDTLSFRSKSTDLDESSVFYSTLSPDNEVSPKDITAAFSLDKRKEAQLEELHNHLSRLTDMSATVRLSLGALKRIFDMLRKDMTELKEESAAGLKDALDQMVEKWTGVEEISHANRQALERVEQEKAELVLQAESYRLQGETAQKLLLEMQEALKESDRKYGALREERDDLQRKIEESDANSRISTENSENAIQDLQDKLKRKDVEVQSLQSQLEAKDSAILPTSPPVTSPLPSFAGFGEMPRQDSLIGVGMLESMSMSIAPLPLGACRCIGPCTCQNSGQMVSRQRFSIGPANAPGGAAGTQQVSISLSSCNVGDLVLFVFNKDFRQFTAYLPFKRSLYLLHTDSQSELGLSIPPLESEGVPALSSDMRTWSVGEVVAKEYVLTKKVPNRYGLQIGTKFYRVRAKAWSVVAMAGEAGSDTAAGRIGSVVSLAQQITGSSSASLQSAGQTDAQSH